MDTIDKNRDFIDRFIHSVFDFYNGKINIFNPAVLHIEYANLWNSPNGGTSRNPNIITIFPHVIERHVGSNQYNILYNIIVTIIHELYHTDQSISYLRMTYDIGYRNYIENVVEMSTYLYIANHQREIYENFGLIDRTNYKDYYPLIAPMFENGQLYQRRDYYTHMIYLLQEILYAEHHEMIDIFSKAFLDENSVIDIKINNLQFTLKDGLYCMPIIQLNEIMENEYFRYNLRKATTEYRSIGKDKHLFIINPNCSNFMGKLVNTTSSTDGMYYIKRTS